MKIMQNKMVSRANAELKSIMSDGYNGLQMDRTLSGSGRTVDDGVWYLSR